MPQRRIVATRILVFDFELLIGDRVKRTRSDNSAKLLLPHLRFTDRSWFHCLFVNAVSAPFFTGRTDHDRMRSYQDHYRVLAGLSEAAECFKATGILFNGKERVHVD
jgi:hypothetical protein